MLADSLKAETFTCQVKILKKAWARNRRLPRDLATNPKYMKSFGG